MHHTYTSRQGRTIVRMFDFMVTGCRRGRGDAPPLHPRTASPDRPVQFTHLLPKKLRVVIEGDAFDNDVSRPNPVKIGKASKQIEFANLPWASPIFEIDFSMHEDPDLIEIGVPSPVPMENGRRLGIGLCRLWILDMSGK
jgi:hypothetical protein